MLLYNEDILNIIDQAYYRDCPPMLFNDFMDPSAPGSAYSLMEANPVYANSIISNPPKVEE
jgi:hypothetical protein